MVLLGGRIGRGAHDPLEIVFDGQLDTAFRCRDVGTARIGSIAGISRPVAVAGEHRKDLAQLVAEWKLPGVGERRLLAMVRGHRMKRVSGADAR